MRLQTALLSGGIILLMCGCRPAPTPSPKPVPIPDRRSNIHHTIITDSRYNKAKELLNENNSSRHLQVKPNVIRH